MSLNLILGIITSIIAIITAIITVIKFFWRKSSASQKLSRRLRIIRITATQDKGSNSCLLDLEVKNLGKTAILLTELTLEVMDIGRYAVKGFLPVSQTYDLDISHLEQIGDIAKVSLNQTVHPESHVEGPFDRFNVKLVAKELGLGRFTAWKLKPALHEESQAVEGEIVEVWLPRPPGVSFAEARSMELAEEIGPVQAIIDNGMKYNKNITAETREKIQLLLKQSEESLTKRDTRAWRKQMGTILQKLGAEDEITPYPYIKAKLFGDLEEFQKNTKLSNSKYMGSGKTYLKEEVTENHISESKIEKLHKNEKANPFEEILRKNNLTEIRSLLNTESFQKQKQFNDFLESLDFIDRIQQLIMDETDLEVVALFLDELSSASKVAAEDILKLNGFYLLIIPHKLNAETNVRKIGLFIKTAVGISWSTGKRILYESEFDHSEFIRKINTEPDIDEIGWCFEWLFYNEIDFAKMIVESPKLDLNILIQKIKTESNPDKISCLKDAIWLCSKKVHAKIEGAAGQTLT